MIVEDGTIVANANSYLSVAELKAYWIQRNVILECTDIPTLESALVISTQYTDNRSWKGFIVTSAQSLDWPRYSVTDDQGREIANNIIPIQLKNAVAEYAYRQLTEEISPDSGIEGDIISQKDKIGSLESETKYQEGTISSKKSFPLADNWLCGLTNGGNLGNFGQVSRCL